MNKPADYARQYAAENPDFTGALDVVSTTRKGKGGWGTTTRTNQFFLSGGIAKARRTDRSKSVDTWNGMCAFCGRLYLDPYITIVHVNHPDAGMATERQIPGQYQRVVAPASHENACLDCIEKHGLETGYHYGSSMIDYDNGIEFVECDLPGIHRPEIRMLDVRPVVEVEAK